MKKIIIFAAFLFVFLGFAHSVLAVIITKNETRDIVDRYGAINPDSPYFPHTRVPHPNSGTSDGRIKTTDVEIYPGTGIGDILPVRTVTISMHDHDDFSVVAVFTRDATGSWAPVVSEYDIPTIGGNTLCGEDAAMYGLNRHPHNDGACYVNHTFVINAPTDALLLQFACAQISNGCPRNDDVHVHLSNITWDIQDDATPTPNATVPPTRTPTIIPTRTLTPTVTIVPPTVTSTPVVLRSCNNLAGCTSGSQCQSGFCFRESSGLQFCRNPSCPTDNDCNCLGGPTPSVVPMGTSFCPV